MYEQTSNGITTQVDADEYQWLKSYAKRDGGVFVKSYTELPGGALEFVKKNGSRIKLVPITG